MRRTEFIDKALYVQVEGGRIDHAHHDTLAHRALDEAVAMDEAVEKALSLTNEEVGEISTSPFWLLKRILSDR